MVTSTIRIQRFYWHQKKGIYKQIALDYVIYYFWNWILNNPSLVYVIGKHRPSDKNKLIFDFFRVFCGE